MSESFINIKHLEHRLMVDVDPMFSSSNANYLMHVCTMDAEASNSTYETRIAFDTFTNKAATDPSFTIVSKHKNYAYQKGSRTFLCGTDQKDYSDFALEYLVTKLVEDGDEVVCVRVVESDSKVANDIDDHQPTYKAEAQQLLEHIQKKNDESHGKAISLILEFAVGKVGETIDRMVRSHISHHISTDRYTTLDWHLLANQPRCWNSRSFTRRRTWPPFRLGQPILPTELAYPCCRCPSPALASAKDGEASCRSEPSRILRYPRAEQRSR